MNSETVFKAKNRLELTAAFIVVMAIWSIVGLLFSILKIGSNSEAKDIWWVFIALGLSHFHAYYLSEYLRARNKPLLVRFCLSMFMLGLIISASFSLLFTYLYPLGPIVLGGLLGIVMIAFVIESKFPNFADKFSRTEKISSALFSAYMVAILLAGVALLLLTRFDAPVPPSPDKAFDYYASTAFAKIIGLILILVSLIFARNMWLAILAWIVRKIPGSKP